MTRDLRRVHRFVWLSLPVLLAILLLCADATRRRAERAVSTPDAGKVGSP